MVKVSNKEGDGTGTPMESEAEDEFHDADAQPTGLNPTLSGPAWKEMHILLKLTYKSNQEADTSPTKHLAILHAMYEAFLNDELVMFDNKGRKIN